MPIIDKLAEPDILKRLETAAALADQRAWPALAQACRDGATEIKAFRAIKAELLAALHLLVGAADDIAYADFADHRTEFLNAITAARAVIAKATG